MIGVAPRYKSSCRSIARRLAISCNYSRSSGDSRTTDKNHDLWKAGCQLTNARVSNASQSAEPVGNRPIVLLHDLSEESKSWNEMHTCTCRAQEREWQRYTQYTQAFGEAVTLGWTLFL